MAKTSAEFFLNKKTKEEDALKIDLSFADKIEKIIDDKLFGTDYTHDKSSKKVSVRIPMSEFMGCTSNAQVISLLSGRYAGKQGSWTEMVNDYGSSRETITFIFRY